MDGLSDDFARAFGHLVYQAANVETGLKVCLAAMLDIRPVHVLALAEPYTGPQLRQVVKVWRKARRGQMARSTVLWSSLDGANLIRISATTLRIRGGPMAFAREQSNQWG